MMLKKTFCYFFWHVYWPFMQHVFLITQKHLTTENPTNANSNWQNLQSNFKISAKCNTNNWQRLPSENKHVNFTAKSVQFNDVMLRFTREQKHRIVHALCLNISRSKA